MKKKGTKTKIMDDITQARYNFVLAFQYCYNGREFPFFRGISTSKQKDIHTGYCAIDLLDEALDLHPNFQEARDLRGDIWHAILTNNPPNDYSKYLNSKAWAETREKFFEQVGWQCICGDTATQVHHKTYANIGKENLLRDLVGLCDRCHTNLHQSRKVNGSNACRARAYWDKFKTYVKENGNQLQLFPEPNLPTIYGIQIDRKTRESADICKAGAFWLVAYRSRNKLQANLYMRSLIRYDRLKKQKDNIEAKFEDSLGELKWEDREKCIGFLDDTVRYVNEVDTKREFPWLHDRLVKLHEVFQPYILEFQKQK